MPETPLYTAAFPVSSLVNLPVFINELEGIVREQLPLKNDAADTVVFKIKVIVSELLTNTIKHTDELATTSLSVTIFDNRIQLIRGDNCAPMHFPETDQRPRLAWPLAASLRNAAYVVYADDLNTLSLIIDEDSKARFTAWQNPDVVLNIPTLNEHFGLLIIALSSDLFTYEYSPVSKENIFTVTIHF